MWGNFRQILVQYAQLIRIVITHPFPVNVVNHLCRCMPHLCSDEIGVNASA